MAATTDWGKRFREISQKDRQKFAVPQTEASFGGELGQPWAGFGGARFGSDVSDAVIAYRRLWDSYVTGTARAMDVGSSALINIAVSPPSGFSSGELTQLADDYAKERDALLQAWNQFSGKTVDDMTAEGGVMLAAFQKTVADAQKFWKDEDASPIKPAGAKPSEPTTAAQATVKAQIDASGALTQSSAALALQSLTGIAAPNISLPSASDVGKAALGFVKDHWVGIGIAAVGLGLGLKAAALVTRGYVKVATGGLL